LAATIFFGIYAVILMLLVCLTILIINRTIITKKAGGINGDILGFGVEISEALVLLGALLLERYGILLVCNF
jgi:cobalamin synthase